MMTLRSRLVLGYVYLTVLLLVAALGGALGFQRLGRSIDTILQENGESVRAATAMIDALERQDSACMGLLLRRDGAAGRMARAEAAFREALERAADNVTVEDERPLLDEIRARFAVYREAREGLVASAPERPLAAYESQVLPRSRALAETLGRLLDVNHRAMLEADRANRGLAWRGSAVLAGLATLALLSIGALSRSLRVHVLDRLEELGAVARAVSDGDHGRRVWVTGDDELGRVGRQLNAALDAQERTEGAAEGRLRQQRQLVLALLESGGAPAAVLGLDRRVVASTLAPDRLSAWERCAEGAGADLEHRPGEEAPASREVEGPDGARWRVRPLIAGGVRPVGWLVRPAGDEGPTPAVSRPPPSP